MKSFHKYHFIISSQIFLLNVVFLQGSLFAILRCSICITLCHFRPRENASSFTNLILCSLVQVLNYTVYPNLLRDLDPKKRCTPYNFLNLSFLRLIRNLILAFVPVHSWLNSVMAINLTEASRSN